MSYTLPTAAEFKARYIEFDALGEARLTFFLEEAEGMVHEDWFEKDYRPGLMAYAAHLLACEGEPGLSGGIGQSAAETAFSGSVIADKVGDAETRWSAPSMSGNTSGGSTADNLKSTAYGNRYLSLAQRQTVGVMVA